MTPKKIRPINPSSQHFVTDGPTRLTPYFYHEELAHSALSVLTKSIPTAQVENRQVQRSGSFEEAMYVLSTESRWLVYKKPDLTILCDGWVSMAKSVDQAPMRSE